MFIFFVMSVSELRHSTIQALRRSSIYSPPTRQFSGRKQQEQEADFVNGFQNKTLEHYILYLSDDAH